MIKRIVSPFEEIVVKLVMHFFLNYFSYMLFHPFLSGKFKFSVFPYKESSRRRTLWKSFITTAS